MPVVEVGMPRGRAGLGMKMMINSYLDVMHWDILVEVVGGNVGQGLKRVTCSGHELSVYECTDYPGERVEWTER